MPEPTIAAGYPAALLEYTVARGADRDTLTRLSGLRDMVLTDPDIRVPLARYLSLFTAGIEECGDPALALHFGEAVPMRDLSLVGLMAQSAESAEAGCQLHNRYGRLTLDEGDGSAEERMALVRERGEVWVTFASSLYVAFPLLVESAFARCVCGIRALYAASHGGARWSYPKAIHFTHAAPSYRAEYDRLFDVPLVFGSDRNGWLMDEAFLAFRQPRSDSYTAHALRRHADVLLERLDASRTTRGQVERLLTPMLRTGVSIGEVASELGLSRQTLLRRLKGEGTTFQQTVDQLRMTLALHCLTTRRLAVKRIAHDLGFSDATAFSRAFRRWTGHSPRTYLSVTVDRNLASSSDPKLS